MRDKAYRPLVDIYQDLDSELVKGAFTGQHFKELFQTNARDGAIKDYVLSLL